MLSTSASTSDRMLQDAEKGFQLRSRLERILNVPQRVRLRFFFPAALLESLCEPPVANAILITPKSRLFDAIPLTSQ